MSLGATGRAVGGKQVGLQNIFGDCSGGDSAGADVDELTTSQGILSHEILHFRISLLSVTARAPARSAYGEELSHRMGCRVNRFS